MRITSQQHKPGRLLMSGKVKVWGNVVTVEWALDPVEEPDPEVMAKVNAVSCVGGAVLIYFFCT